MRATAEMRIQAGRAEQGLSIMQMRETGEGENPEALTVDKHNPKARQRHGQ